MTTHNSSKFFARKSTLAAAVVLCTPLFLTACGGDSSAGSTSSNLTDESTASTLSGTATKGPIDAATITVFALNADGSRGEYLGETTTDADGRYSLEIDHDGPVSVVATEGTYIDEASGLTVALAAGVELETLLASAQEGENVAVTALTTIAAARAKATAGFGLEMAISSASLEVAEAFGLGEVDITATIPADLSRDQSAQASVEARNYGLVQAGLTQIAEDAQMSADSVLTMVRQMAEDFTDGVMDGKDHAGAAITTALSITPEQAHVGLQAAMSAFLQSSENRSGMPTPDITIPSADGAAIDPPIPTNGAR